MTSQANSFPQPSDNPKLILRAKYLDSRAQRWIRDGHPATILHVFPRVCNLLNTEGEVLSIVSSEIGKGPFSVLVEIEGSGSSRFNGFTHWLEVYSPIRISSTAMGLGELELDLRRARLWDPHPDWNRIRSSRNEWLDLLPGIRKILDREAPGDSLHRVLDVIPSLDGENLRPRGALSLVQTNAIVSAQRLCRGILTQDENVVMEGALVLAGLGGGLTPAGDDFLMGVFLGLRTIVPAEMINSYSEKILPAVLPRTNAISASWLQAAAQGEAHEMWHQFLHAIADKDSDDLNAALGRILDVGHTSGADTLAGFLITSSLNLEGNPHPYN